MNRLMSTGPALYAAVRHNPAARGPGPRLTASALLVAACLTASSVTAPPPHGAARGPVYGAGPVAASEAGGAALSAQPGIPVPGRGVSSTGAVPVAALRPVPQPAAAELAVAPALAQDGIPAVALDGYIHAVALADQLYPACHIPWSLLAGIGRVESDHGRFAGSVLLANGVSTPKIIGIQLNGHGTELILDTDHGALDGDPVYDRAVGPMQFIPSTWKMYATDGNHDGVADPFNIYDAAAAAAKYLCQAGGDLRTQPGKTRAVLTYNHSDAYLASVLALQATYAGTTIPTTTAHVTMAPLPPASPGQPPAIHLRPKRHPTTPPATRTPTPSPSEPATTVPPSPSPLPSPTASCTTAATPTTTSPPDPAPTPPSPSSSPGPSATTSVTPSPSIDPSSTPLTPTTSASAPPTNPPPTPTATCP